MNIETTISEVTPCLNIDLSLKQEDNPNLNKIQSLRDSIMSDFGDDFSLNPINSVYLLNPQVFDVFKTLGQDAFPEDVRELFSIDGHNSCDIAQYCIKKYGIPTREISFGEIDNFLSGDTLDFIGVSLFKEALGDDNYVDNIDKIVNVFYSKGIKLYNIDDIFSVCIDKNRVKEFLSKAYEKGLISDKIISSTNKEEINDHLKEINPQIRICYIKPNNLLFNAKGGIKIFSLYDVYRPSYDDLEVLYSIDKNLLSKIRLKISAKDERITSDSQLDSQNEGDKKLSSHEVLYSIYYKLYRLGCKEVILEKEEYIKKGALSYSQWLASESIK